MTCPFCNIPKSDHLIETDHVIGFFDRYPVSPGHMLLVPRRHIATWFEATAEERAALIDVIDDAVAIIETRLERRPDVNGARHCFAALCDDERCIKLC